MSQQRDQVQQQTRASQQTIHTANDVEAQADSLLERARTEQSGQANLLDAPAVESQYSAALAAQVESKHDQAERIEDRLENLIERQASRLQQSRSQQPGLIALPGTRSRWQQQLQQQQSTMQRLQGRLEMVREIKEGMGLHGSRIDDLATHKLRHLEPGLAREWDELQVELRRHLAVQRKKEQELRQQALVIGKGVGLSNSLVISTKTQE
jgi:hypothetical protein